ncbi:unnamed protein product [Protopolystoma xenopodis]|uniref:Uncharacterized protein n=1 Tax=Protopolystoma xenopodis TaxID=117903 RepID=A0A3S5B726_9PLAT|nr:unnamed protein product [Protopolystoma xenopodis]
MDTEISELAEHIAITGHTIDWNATENIKKRKIREAVYTFQRNLMSRRLEEGIFGDNSVYCLERPGDSEKTSKEDAWARKRHHKGAAHEI